MNAEGGDVAVPGEYVKDGRIVLSVAPRAVRSLDLGNEAVAFGARFAGRPFEVYVPVRHVLAVYAQENGKGIALGEEDPTSDTPPPDAPPKKKGPPRLRVVS